MTSSWTSSPGRGDAFVTRARRPPVTSGAGRRTRRRQLPLRTTERQCAHPCWRAASSVWCAEASRCVNAVCRSSPSFIPLRRDVPGNSDLAGFLEHRAGRRNFLRTAGQRRCAARPPPAGCRWRSALLEDPTGPRISRSSRTASRVACRSGTALSTSGRTQGVDDLVDSAHHPPHGPAQGGARLLGD